LSASAVRAGGGLFFHFTFICGEREELGAVPAWSDLKECGSILVDIRRQEEFQRIIAEDDAICELDDGQAIVEHFERRFLSFAFGDMSHHEYRLSFALDTQIS
jgi:hypothetical protein